MAGTANDTENAPAANSLAIANGMTLTFLDMTLPFQMIENAPF
jgi:hypothetical protein